MGAYNTYGNVQIKVGECACKHYKVGDKVSIEDGIYIGWEGFVIIKDGLFIAESERAYTKWGGLLLPEDILKQL